MKAVLEFNYPEDERKLQMALEGWAMYEALVNIRMNAARHVSNKNDMLDVIHSVVDDRYFLEVHQHYAKNIVVGFARIDAKTTALGSVTVEAFVLPTRNRRAGLSPRRAADASITSRGTDAFAGVTLRWMMSWA